MYEPKIQNLLQSQNIKFRYCRIPRFSIFLTHVNIAWHCRNPLAVMFSHRTNEHNVEKEEWGAKFILRLRIYFSPYIINAFFHVKSVPPIHPNPSAWKYFCSDYIIRNFFTRKILPNRICSKPSARKYFHSYHITQNFLTENFCPNAFARMLIYPKNIINCVFGHMASGKSFQVKKFRPKSFRQKSFRAGEFGRMAGNDGSELSGSKTYFSEPQLRTTEFDSRHGKRCGGGLWRRCRVPQQSAGAQSILCAAVYVLSLIFRF